MIKEKTYLVLIKNLILKAYVGIYPKEKIRKQKVRFNISISALNNIKTKTPIALNDKLANSPKKKISKSPFLNLPLYKFLTRKNAIRFKKP